MLGIPLYLVFNERISIYLCRGFRLIEDKFQKCKNKKKNKGQDKNQNSQGTKSITAVRVEAANNRGATTYIHNYTNETQNSTYNINQNAGSKDKWTFSKSNRKGSNVDSLPSSKLLGSSKVDQNKRASSNVPATKDDSVTSSKDTGSFKVNQNKIKLSAVPATNLFPDKDPKSLPKSFFIEVDEDDDAAVSGKIIHDRLDSHHAFDDYIFVKNRSTYF